MKRIFTLIFSLFIAVAANAQSVDEILAKYFENIGGVSKWKSLESLKMNGNLKTQGLELPMVIIQAKDGRQASSIIFQGKEVKQGVYDGSTLWSHNFMNMKAEKSDAEATENFKKDIGEFPDPFLNYKERGLKVELLGKETIDGTETFKIKLTKKPIKVDGKETENIVFYYFDTENFVPLMSESEIKSGPAKGQVSITKFSDYQEVNGLMFAFSMAQSLKGQPANTTISVTSVEVNPKLDAAIFAFPGN